MKSKNQRRREKLRNKKHQTPDQLLSTQNENVLSPPISSDSATSGSKLTILSRKYDWMREDDALFPMFSEISAKFQRKRAKFVSSADDSESAAPSNSTSSTDVVPPPSKKQQRLAAKPSLAHLKSLSAFPERIQWFDADAPHPEFLVRLKSVPKAVPVPSNWLARQDIPQFAARPRYDPPDAIKSLNFGTQTSADGATKPSMAAADVDYEQLHSLFHNQPSPLPHMGHLLPFGQVIDLNLRRLGFKPKASNSTLGKTRPKTVSPRLRAALNLAPNAPLPWASFVAENGVAPGYRQYTEPEQLWGENYV